MSSETVWYIDSTALTTEDISPELLETEYQIITQDLS